MKHITLVKTITQAGQETPEKFYWEDRGTYKIKHLISPGYVERIDRLIYKVDDSEEYLFVVHDPDNRWAVDETHIYMCNSEGETGEIIFGNRTGEDGFCEAYADIDRALKALGYTRS